jgi:hypothetical protein
MAKAKHNPSTSQLSGKIGDLVYVTTRTGENYVRPAPHRKPKTEWTDSQKTEQAGMRDAVLFAKSVNADPAQRQAYEALGRKRCRSAFITALSDKRQRPEILDVDLSGYTGSAGQLIQVKAVDNVEVASVSVQIRHTESQLLEQGAAVFKARNKRWVYQTQVSLPVQQVTVSIEVTATDRASNTTIKRLAHIVRLPN